MLVKCCVKGCLGSSASTSTRMVTFPRDLERRLKWIDFCDNPDMEKRRGHVTIYQKICASHFELKYFMNADRKNMFIISSKPVPTLKHAASDTEVPCICKAKSEGLVGKESSCARHGLPRNTSQVYTTLVLEQREEDHHSPQSITEHLVPAENAMDVESGNARTSNNPEIIDLDGANEEKVEPLYLSSYLGRDPGEGRSLSRVVPLTGNVRSHSGYFTVNREHDSHMFFWFFPLSVNSPLVVWINGPCESGCNGTFKQSGPYLYDGKDITLRPYSWNNLYNMLYIDAPVGFGFSFTKGQGGRPTDSETVGADLYSTISQFLEMFSDYRECNLYVTGMGIGAKLAIALAHRLALYRDPYFKGLALGNPLLDVEIQTDHIAYLTALGVMDSESAHHCERKQIELKNALKEKNETTFMKAFTEYYLKPNSVLHDVTGLDSTFSFIQNLNVDDIHWLELVNSSEMKFALHVGSEAVWDEGDIAFHSMPSLYMESSLPRLSVILENAKVMLINGQEDLRFPYPMMMNCARSIEWSQKLVFAVTKRFRVQREPAGIVEAFSKRCETLTTVMIRNASHFVFSDRPDFTLQVFSNFVKCQPPMLEKAVRKQRDVSNNV